MRSNNNEVRNILKNDCKTTYEVTTGKYKVIYLF